MVADYIGKPFNYLIPLAVLLPGAKRRGALLSCLCTAGLSEDCIGLRVVPSNALRKTRGPRMCKPCAREAQRRGGSHGRLVRAEARRSRPSDAEAERALSRKLSSFSDSERSLYHAVLRDRTSLVDRREAADLVGRECAEVLYG